MPTWCFLILILYHDALQLFILFGVAGGWSQSQLTLGKRWGTEKSPVHHTAETIRGTFQIEILKIKLTDLRSCSTEDEPFRYEWPLYLSQAEQFQFCLVLLYFLKGSLRLNHYPTTTNSWKKHICGPQRMNPFDMSGLITFQQESQDELFNFYGTSSMAKKITTWQQLIAEKIFLLPRGWAPIVWDSDSTTSHQNHQYAFSVQQFFFYCMCNEY